MAEAQYKDGPIRTTCKECLFATYTNNIQTGCQLNRIERFQQLGMLTPIYEDNKSYFEIERFCNRCRNDSWKNIVVEEKGPYADLKQEVIDETRIKVSFLVYIDDNTNLGDLEQLVANVDQQSLPAHEIVTVNNGQIKPKLITDILLNGKSKWKNVQIKWEETNKEFALDEGYKNVEGMYFAQVDLPCIISPLLIELLDLELNEKLNRFLYIKFGENPNLHIYQRYITNCLKGNNPFEFYDDNIIVNNLAEKIQYFANKNKQEHMVLEW
ncbi:MAG TPA: hypothetical protein VFV86_05170 [Nitrososphaeraceae archaeon]|nr:hypothetical protein [Nitrososphaeraceae archaeon]